MEELVLNLQKDTRKESLLNTMRQACKKIAPVWPLENFVAVNPYLGLTDQKFESVAHQLATFGGIQMTLPTSFYIDKIKEGVISKVDLSAVLYKKSQSLIEVNEFISRLENLEDHDQHLASLRTLASIATQTTGKDWNRFLTSRISTWAASYFDNGQASWVAAENHLEPFAAWKKEAETDLTPEITGLKGFRNIVKSLPNDPIEAAKKSLELLEITKNEQSIYLHCLLLQMGGWAAYAARLDWDNELYGGKDGKLIEFLSILICWEACIYQSLDKSKLKEKWTAAKTAFDESQLNNTSNEHLTIGLILQEAFDLANQRQIIQKINQSEIVQKETNTKTKAQAIFCIDVRSEVYRRNLEMVDKHIETLGFAGFFAFPINYVPIGHDKGEAQCPVLIKTGPTILEEMSNKKLHQKAHNRRVLKNQTNQIWKSFKSGAVSCFSFVSPLGLSYLPKLFTDSYGLTRPVPHPDNMGLTSKYSKNKSISLEVANHNQMTVGIPLEQQVEMAKNALNAMSLTENFAPFVMIVGHGSTTINNPHATGLDCGACGGHTGEANAKVAAAVLNNKEVRKQLCERQIFIPDSTLFLACLHDTTTDEISIFNEHEVPTNLKEELNELKQSLSQAGHATRTERAIRMSIKGDVDSDIKERSKDWSQVRPEWGLAGCSAFVVAPRGRTKNIDFGGKSFLHSYDWKQDKGFSILELIMTAPMVVTSWINLQYYASTVDNKKFGSGNKTLHNVTAGVGILEGHSGDLRVGLPIQSVHDGKKYQHEPNKLNVIIEAPIEAMNAILEKHPTVRNLCDNEWIYLLAMDQNGKVSHKYIGDLAWEKI